MSFISMVEWSTEKILAYTRNFWWIWLVFVQRRHDHSIGSFKKRLLSSEMFYNVWSWTNTNIVCNMLVSKHFSTFCANNSNNTCWTTKLINVRETPSSVVTDYLLDFGSFCELVRVFISASSSRPARVGHGARLSANHKVDHWLKQV